MHSTVELAKLASKAEPSTPDLNLTTAHAVVADSLETAPSSEKMRCSTAVSGVSSVSCGGAATSASAGASALLRRLGLSDPYADLSPLYDAVDKYNLGLIQRDAALLRRARRARPGRGPPRVW